MKLLSSIFRQVSRAPATFMVLALLPMLGACGAITVRNEPVMSSRLVSAASGGPSPARVAPATPAETAAGRIARHEEGLRLARLLRDQGRLQAAVDVYAQLDRGQYLSPLEVLEYASTAALVLSPQESLSLFGRARRELRREGKALGSAAQVTLCGGLARARLALGQAEEALTDFDCVLGQEAENLAALNGKGVALDALGRHAEARALFAHAMELDPADFRVVNNLALSHLASGNRQEAIRLLSRAGSNGLPAARLNLALTYLLDAQDALAKQTLQDLMPEGLVEKAWQELGERRLRIASGAPMGGEFLAASQHLLALREGNTP